MGQTGGLNLACHPHVSPLGNGGLSRAAQPDEIVLVQDQKQMTTLAVLAYDMSKHFRRVCFENLGTFKSRPAH